MCSELVIKTQGLGKCYQVYSHPRDRLLQMLLPNGRQRYRPFWAVKDVSLEVRRGESLGIIGRNGSGKSTLLQLICGIVGASSGSVTSHGRIAALLELGSGFNPEFTGRENVYLNAAVLGLTRGETEARFEEITAFANIGEFIDQPTRTYSSGMLIRLAFAVSICVEPDILIVDEALAVGDASFQFKCLERLERLVRQGTTLLFVSHDMSMVKRFCNRVLYLRNGEVRASGAPEEVAELYLLDMRDEQRRGASAGTIQVTTKPALGQGQGIAFGTNEGQIASALFSATGTSYCSFVHGDPVEIEVQATVSDQIARPNLSLTVQEARLLVVAGANVALACQAPQQGWCSASTRLSFTANLAPGRYHVTLKLMNGETEETSQLIEKQVAPLAFDILPGDKHFLGLVDLDIRAVEPEPPNIARPAPRPMDKPWQVAIFGTFDVANYGDLLFPIIAEHELQARLGAVQLRAFSYHQRSTPRWPYDVTSVSELPELVDSLDGVLIGGGFIIRFDKLVAVGYYPPTPQIHHPTGYWLSPALLALQHDVPLIWNAPGMHCNEIPSWARPLLRLSLELSPHVRVRDTPSREALSALSEQAQVEVLPDTAFGLANLIDLQRPSAEYRQLCQRAGLGKRYLVVHAITGLENFLQLWRAQGAGLEQWQLLLLPIGPVLGDHESILGDDLPRAVTLPYWPSPLLLAEILGHAEGVIGHSYHLAITALAFGVPIFSSANLHLGKYSALLDYQGIYPLPSADPIALEWFLERLRRRSPCPRLEAAREQLREHWDRVAELIRQGRRPTRQWMNRLWQDLPNQLEGQQQDWREECLRQRAELDDLRRQMQQLQQFQE
ncbi:MAG: polysaccharide pyruvyl transferase family protein [Pseudomonas piscis]|uniref:polysaccharide pyruvyl transferase family protein n=1 Tax=Pseudomonas piscis TaxID=2614538 RepID=UPI003D282B77